MADEIDLPPLPDTATVTQVAGVIRHVLTTLAGMGILAGFTVSDSNLMVFTSVGVWLATIGWSLWQKFESHKTITTLHAAAATQPPAVGTPPNA